MAMYFDDYNDNHRTKHFYGEFGKSKGEEHEVMVCLVYRNDDVCEFNKKRRRKYK